MERKHLVNIHNLGDSAQNSRAVHSNLANSESETEQQFYSGKLHPKRKCLHDLLMRVSYKMQEEILQYLVPQGFSWTAVASLGN